MDVCVVVVVVAFFYILNIICCFMSWLLASVASAAFGLFFDGLLLDAFGGSRCFCRFWVSWHRWRCCS